MVVPSRRAPRLDWLSETDWRRYLSLEPDGCFLAIYNDKPAGTVTTISYGRKFGWIGMLLVHPSMRRNGIGTALLHKAMDYLKNIGVETVKLDATLVGKMVYVPIGFLEEYNINRRQGIGTINNCNEFPLIEPDKMQDIIDFDANIFGFRRGNVLERLAIENPDLGFVSRSHSGCVQGYIMARKGLNAYQIGPWISVSRTVAEELFVLMLNKLQNEKIFLDVPDVNEKGINIVEKHGFNVQRKFTRMFLGSNSYPGKPVIIYATSSPEKG